MNENGNNKKKKMFGKGIVLLTLLLIIPILIAVALSTSYSINTEEYDAGGNGIGTLTLTWLEGDQSYAGHVDENGILQVTPTANVLYDEKSNTGGGVRVSYQIIFNMGGSESADAGTIKIKIPRYIFYGRDGLPLTDQVFKSSLPEAPLTNDSNFNYRYETGNDGVEYIVLENFNTISPSANFVASFSWVLRDPSTVANGFTKKIKGTVDIDLDKDGTTDLSSTSNELEMKYNTSAEIREVKKGYTKHFDEDEKIETNVYSVWQSTWADELKPANADNYVYAVYYASAEVYYATQPYTITFTDKVTDNLGGEIIGYCRYNVNVNYNDSINKSGDSGLNCFKKTITDENTGAGKAIHKASLTPLSATVDQPAATKDEIGYFFFLVKYPRNKIQNNVEHELSDIVTATLVPLDGGKDAKTAELTVKYKSEYVDPDEKRSEGNIPARVIANEKFGWRNYYGGIDLIEKSKDGTELPLGYGPDLNGGTYYSFRFGKYIQDFPSTLKKGGNASNSADFGQREWTANFVDDIGFLGDELLTKDDYVMKSMGLNSYSVADFVYTEDGYIRTTLDWEDRPEIKVYYTKDFENWELYGSIKSNAESKYTFTTLTGETYSGSHGGNASIVPLPDGVVGIKGSVTSKHGYVDLTLNVQCYLIVNDHTREIIKDKDSVYFRNYSTAYSEDGDGKIYGTLDGDAADGSLYEALSGTRKEIIEGLDEKKYGHVIQHYSGSTYFTRLKEGSTHQNKWVTYENDPLNRMIKANYTAYAFEYVPAGSFNGKELLDLGVINEQREGTFYDLLPIGMTVDLDSISVQTFKTPSEASEYDYDKNEAGVGVEIPNPTVTLVDNWQGSGRTMLIVKAVVPNDVNNYYINSSYSHPVNLYSGMTLRFTGMYSWDSIYDYGSNLTNTIAYKSGSGRLTNGYKDDASEQTGLALKDFMSDLDEDGNPEATTIADTVYAQRTMAISENTASSALFSKGVKTLEMVDYVDGKDGSVVVSAGGNYTYRLRYASAQNSSTTNFVMYDVLEDFEDGVHENWKGVLQRVDVSQIANKGVDVKVYYSTKKNIDLYVNGKAAIDLPHPPDANLSDTSIWSLTPPEDMSLVTAIAIDCTTDKDGNPYTLGQESSLVALLTMRAPIENVNALVAKNAKALNAAWWSGITKQGNEPEHDNFSVIEWTQVGLLDMNLEIDKESHVPSGTKNSPAIVQNGDTLTYDIIVKNTSTSVSHNTVKVRDILPDAVIPKINEIAYYIEGEGSFENPTLLSESGLVKLDVDGQKLEFTINRLLAEETIHLLIPTIVNSKDINTIENTAVLFEFDGIDFNEKTSTTYHKVGLGSLTIKKKVVGGDKSKKFRFKITLIDKDVSENSKSSNNEQFDPLNTTYDDVEFVNGVAYIYLSDGESKTIVGLSTGLRYTVEEDDYSTDGYFMDIKNATGTIKYSEEVIVEVTNTYFENPNTGARAKFIIVLMMLGAIILIVLRKHKSKILRV